MAFEKTERQVLALDVLNKHVHGMLYGGSRSGKTAIIIRAIFVRALAKTSKHLIVRFRFNAARTSLSYETIPYIVKECFPEAGIYENKSDNYWVVPAADGGESQVWIGGTDDHERIEKVLGKEYCLDPESRVLTADLDWVSAGDLVPGQELVAFPEDVEGHIKLQGSTVERADVIRAQKFLVSTDKGDTVVSARHLFVCRQDDRRHRNARSQSWVAAKDLVEGDVIKFACEPWGRDDSREGGWLAGMMDGEGWVSRGGVNCGVAQNPGPVLEELRRAFKRSGVEWREHVQGGSRCISLVAVGMWAAMRLLGTCRPIRMMTRSRELWEGRRGFTRGSEAHDARVLRVSAIGVGPVVALRTSSRTLIADGFLGHNSTIYVNEASQVPWEAIPTLWTRLAETSGLNLKMFYDCNPPGRKHWTNVLFHEGHLPDDPNPHGLDVGSLRMNPIHNIANLPPEYIKTLERLPLRQRQRFLEGLYLSDVEGALWTDEMVAIARAKEPGVPTKTIVSVDPSVSNNADSDECGIGVLSLCSNGEGLVHDDLSGKMSTRSWAHKAVSAFHAWEANEIVAEKNQGGDLVKDAIHNIDPGIKVVLVHAAKGKFARAEPVSMLYEKGQERVAHAKHLPELESELTEYVPSQSKGSPNRLDWLVHGLTHLMIKPRVRIHVG